MTHYSSSTIEIQLKYFGISTITSQTLCPYKSPVACKFLFVFCSKFYKLPVPSFILRKSQVHPTLEYSSHRWSEALSSFMSVYKLEAIWLIRYSTLNSELELLAWRRLLFPWTTSIDDITDYFLPNSSLLFLLF